MTAEVIRELAFTFMVFLGAISFGVWQKNLFAALWMLAIFAALAAPGV